MSDGAVAAESEAVRLAALLAPLRVGMVHGRIKPAERDAEMTRFRDGDLDVLVGTTVVEVGVDVPAATMMIVEGADRFGLAQLHQLRGRVGRGLVESFCVLVSDSTDEVAQARLKAVAEIRDGFELAERDFELRREGDVLGWRRAGCRDSASPRSRIAAHRDLARPGAGPCRGVCLTRPVGSTRRDRRSRRSSKRAGSGGWRRLSRRAACEPSAPRAQSPANEAGRVIAGTARGTRLQAAGSATRPLGDRVKQTLFAILEPDLPGARVLDLLRAVARRGSRPCRAAPRMPPSWSGIAAALRAIAANLSRARLADRATIVGAEVIAWLRRPDLAAARPVSTSSSSIRRTRSRICSSRRSNWLALRLPAGRPGRGQALLAGPAAASGSGC